MARWTRKWVRDLATDDWSPIPTRVISNEEYAPLGQTPEQAQVAARLRETSRQHARVLGVTRRDFLRSGPGFAAALLAMNEVFGPFFDVHPVEALEAPAFSERSPGGQFVFDVQTHHVEAPKEFPALLELRRRARRWNAALTRDPVMEDLYLENFIKEVFLDSDTAAAVLSGIPSATDVTNVLPPARIAETRDVVNRLAASPRLFTHGLITPNKGAADLDAMDHQAETLGVSAWKGYTGLPFGDPPRAWRLDDEKVAYPMLERARRLGVKIICLHKGLPFTGTAEDGWHPRDLARAARDFPDLTFIAYHGGFRSLAQALDGTRDRFRRIERVDWVSDLCAIRERHPGLTNVYAEIGSTFAMTVITAPLLCAHILGMLVKALDEDHVLWGTDAIWWGSPRWQLEAFRRLRMPETLARRYGYAPLTALVKAKILGLNAARVYGVDPGAPRNAVPPDFVSRLRAAYQEEGPGPSLAQYGWVLAD